MYYFNIALCVVFALVIAAEIWFIIRRNRRIKIKGKDNLFFGAMVLLVAVLLLPLEYNFTLIEILRDVLILVALFATGAIRRGVSDNGVEKLFFTVPWEKVNSVNIGSYQTNKVQAEFISGKMKYRLLFPAFRVKELVHELQQHIEEVYVQGSIQGKI